MDHEHSLTHKYSLQIILFHKDLVAAIMYFGNLMRKL